MDKPLWLFAEYTQIDQKMKEEPVYAFDEITEWMVEVQNWLKWRKTNIENTEEFGLNHISERIQRIMKRNIQELNHIGWKYQFE